MLIPLHDAVCWTAGVDFCRHSPGPVFILLGMRMHGVVRFHHEPGRNLGIVRSYVEILVTKNVRTRVQGAAAKPIGRTLVQRLRASL